MPCRKHSFPPTTVVGPIAPQTATDMGNGLELIDFGADYTGRAVDVTSGPCALFDDGGVKWCVLLSLLLHCVRVVTRLVAV